MSPGTMTHHHVHDTADGMVDFDQPHGPGLLASAYFWVGGLISGEFWVALGLWALMLR